MLKFQASYLVLVLYVPDCAYAPNTKTKLCGDTRYGLTGGGRGDAENVYSLDNREGEANQEEEEERYEE